MTPEQQANMERCQTLCRACRYQRPFLADRRNADGQRERAMWHSVAGFEFPCDASDFILAKLAEEGGDA